MTKLSSFKVFSLWILLLEPTGLCSPSGLDSGGRRRLHEVNCRENLEYSSGNICCSNCPSGTRLKSPCTLKGETGDCEKCDDGWYTEHSNNLDKCLACTLCRSDQEVVRPCTHTQNTDCQCKRGWFCVPDQACEVCKKCLKCKEGEEIVRNCTSTTNTECKKIQPKPDPESANTSMIVPLSLLAVVFILVLVVIPVGICRSRRSADSQRNPSETVKAEQLYSDNRPTDEEKNGDLRRLSCSTLLLSRQLVRPKSSVCVEDERTVLCESLDSSASNSQHSLTSPPSFPFPAPPPRSSPAASRREDEPFPKLVAVNGEDSLRRCFEYLEEIDIDYHKRFFRYLGIADNVIKGKEHLPYEDKMHELLNIWMEKVGRDSNLNDLLTALLALNQRRTAEIIKEQAVHNGHYFCQD